MDTTMLAHDNVSVQIPRNSVALVYVDADGDTHYVEMSAETLSPKLSLTDCLNRYFAPAVSQLRAYVKAPR